MKRICIQFDECKPHWAKQRGYDTIAVRCGLINIKLLGDFDSKLTYIYGDVSDFAAFERALDRCGLLDHASLYEVTRESNDERIEALRRAVGNATMMKNELPSD